MVFLDSFKLDAKYCAAALPDVAYRFDMHVSLHFNNISTPDQEVQQKNLGYTTGLPLFVGQNPSFETEGQKVNANGFILTVFDSTGGCIEVSDTPKQYKQGTVAVKYGQVDSFSCSKAFASQDELKAYCES